MCSVDLRTAIPPRSPRPGIYVPKWADHIMKCARDTAIAAWEATERQRYPDGLSVRRPIQEKWRAAVTKEDFGSWIPSGFLLPDVLRGPIGYRRAAGEVRVSGTSHGASCSLPPCTRVRTRPIARSRQRRVLLQPRPVYCRPRRQDQRVSLRGRKACGRAAEGVASYGIDSAMSVPDGELCYDVAVDATSNRKYTQISGPLHSIARDRLCLLCTNDATIAGTERRNLHFAGPGATQSSIQTSLRVQTLSALDAPAHRPPDLTARAPKQAVPDVAV